MGKQWQTRPLGLQKFMTNLDSTEALLIFLANGSNSGCALHPLIVGGHGEVGDGQAVADKATAPKIYGKPGQCGSAAGLFMDVSNSDNFNCSMPTPSDHHHRLAQVAASERVHDDKSKLQKKLRVTKVKITKEKRHSQWLASKVKKDSQTIHLLHQNIDDQQFYLFHQLINV
jgi:hypothetical protein